MPRISFSGQHVSPELVQIDEILSRPPRPSPSLRRQPDWTSSQKPPT